MSRPAIGPRCGRCPCPDVPACVGQRYPAYCRSLAEDLESARKVPGWVLAWPAVIRRQSGLVRPEAPPGPWPDRGPARPGAVRVGFLVAAFDLHGGGVESWHRTLLPRLAAKPGIDVVGLAARRARGVALAALEPACPVATGEAALEALAAACDVAVAWGLADLAAYLPRESPPKVVAVSHGDAGSTWTATWMAEAAPRVDRFVAVSPAALGPVPESRRPAATVIPNGVDPGRVAPTLPRERVRASWGVPPGSTVVGYLGRLAGEKRPGRLVAAMRHLPDSFRLVLAGSGGLEAELRLAAAEMPEGRVTFLGEREQVGDVLVGLDCLASPSEQEGFGLSVVEAWAAGVPVIATPRGVAAEHPDCVRTVPVAAGPEAWAAAIRAEAGDPFGAAIRAAKARQVASDLYSAESFACRWAELLAGYLPRGSKPRVPLGQPVAPPPGGR